MAVSQKLSPSPHLGAYPAFCSVSIGVGGRGGGSLLFLHFVVGINLYIHLSMHNMKSIICSGVFTVVACMVYV
jgi:hypothetical protein